MKLKKLNNSEYKTKWDLTLMYSSPNDSEIEKDLQKIDEAYDFFENKYKNKDTFLTDENVLLTSLTDFENLQQKVGGSKPLDFFYRLKDIDNSNQKAEAEINKITERLSKNANKVVFYELALGKIPFSLQSKFLASKKLSHFKYFLNVIFKKAAHNLSEDEEKILNLKSLPGYSMWVNGFQKLLYTQSVSFKNKKLSLPEAQNIIATLPVKMRRRLQDSVMEVFKNVSDFAESEINAVYTDKKINDELRKFENPYDSTILNHETDKETILSLKKVVTDNFHLSHDFYKLKAKLLKLDYLEYADRSVSIEKNSKKISFDESVTIIKNTFGEVDNKFAEIFESFLKDGKIDAFPKAGKRGGAYCAGGIGIPTFVMLNHVPDFKSLTVMAHEMGHAIHTELSKIQTPLYQGYSTAVAEVASTLFEQFVFDKVFQTLDKKQKIIALHDKINDDISTIFRQIACFNFELELHNSIGARGALSKEEIAKLMNFHMASYMGPSVRLKENDGYFFVGWSHIRRFFYVYSYAYGGIISKALYENYKKNKNFISSIKKFLSAGGSKSPRDIFKDAGIDTTDPEFFKSGIKSIENDIQTLRDLTGH